MIFKFIKNLVLLILLVFISLNSKAATQGQLLLQGNVPVILSISIDPTAESNNLNFENTQTDLLVATSHEISNSYTGYKILMSSNNNGELTRIGGSETIPYSLKYDSNPIILSNTPISVKEVNTPGVYSYFSDITISYSGALNQDRVSGVYQDTLVIEILSN